MRRTLHMMITSFAVVGTAALWPHSSQAENLDGFVLRTWNKMECRPQQLHLGATIEIRLPPQPGNYLSIQAPGGRHVFVIFPQTQFELIHSSTELSTMTNLSIDTSSTKGVQTRTMEPAFIEPGAYTILVGTQFETERPIVRGWCRVSLRAAK